MAVARRRFGTRHRAATYKGPRTMDHGPRTTMNVASVFVSPAAEADRYLPEGPHTVTVAGRPAVAWVNIQTAADATRGAIHLRFWDTGEVRSLPQPGRPGFLVPTDRPGVVLAGEDKQLGTVDLTT